MRDTFKCFSKVYERGLLDHEQLSFQLSEYWCKQNLLSASISWYFLIQLFKIFPYILLILLVTVISLYFPGFDSSPFYRHCSYMLLSIPQIFYVNLCISGKIIEAVEIILSVHFRWVPEPHFLEPLFFPIGNPINLIWTP